MTGTEAVEQVRAQREERHCFVKWWRTHDDFVEFELIDPFLAGTGPSNIIDGFELFDLAGMWQLFLDLNPDRLSRVKRNGDELIEWRWQDSDGQDRLSSYPYTPAGLKALIDEEFFA